jgi:hypothetical protein
MTTESAKYLSTLHEQIDRYFNFSEVKTLCFNLGVDYENIPGDIRSAFIRNLIISLAKRDRLQELVDLARRERPRVNWQDVPPNFELPPSMAQENIQQVVNYHVYGDYVGGDKIGGDKIGGDKITVGHIENAQGVAIGGGASAQVRQEAPRPAERPSPTPVSATTMTPAVQQAAERVSRYLQMASDGQKAAAGELAASLNLILAQAGQKPADPLHLKLLCLGQMQLARQLAADLPGIEQVVEGFTTAVQEQLQ